MSKHTEYAAGLRELADWIEAHENMDLPSTEALTIYSLNTKQEAACCLAAMMPCKKEYKGELFALIRDFGPIKLKAVFYRNAVCTRRVVGTKEVGTEIIPARLTPEQVIPAHTREIVEWDCESILQGNHE